MQAACSCGGEMHYGHWVQKHRAKWVKPPFFLIFLQQLPPMLKEELQISSNCYLWLLLALTSRARPWSSLASWLRDVAPSHKPCPCATPPRWLSSSSVVQIYFWSLSFLGGVRARMVELSAVKRRRKQGGTSQSLQHGLEGENNSATKQRQEP